MKPEFLPRAIKFLFFLTALTPVVYISSSIFPFVLPKLAFYRGIVEVSLILFLVWLVWDRGAIRGVIEKWRRFFRRPLFLATTLFFVVSAGLSTAFSFFPYNSFFGDVKRGEGFMALIHYFVFFVLALVIFERKDWLKFFRILLGVGIVAAFYGWLQFLNITRFPFALGYSQQPASFTGNTAYLAVLSLFLIGILGLLTMRDKSRWKVYMPLALFFVVTVFITAIRGAIVALFIGILFFLLGLLFGYKGQAGPRLKKLAALFLVIVLLMGVGFWLTRTTGIWDEVPGLRRFAKASFDIPSVTTRIMALGISWDAIKERPLLGWGLENYNIAYNKYYNPEHSLYSEEWFDRAHNKIAGIGVTQGILGLLTYLIFWIVLLGTLYRRRRLDFHILGSLMVVYFIQNLFLFDQFTSYIPLFAILGFILVETTEEGGEEASKEEKRSWRGLIVFFTIVLVPVLLYSLYAFNYVPLKQGLNFISAFKLGEVHKIRDASSSFLEPYNFGQAALRGQAVEVLQNNNAFGKQGFRPLTAHMLEALEEAVEREPYEPRDYIRLIEGYNEFAKDDPEFFDKSEKYARAAVELAPKRQGVLTHLAFVLSGERRHEEAIEVNRQAITLAPKVAKEHYQLAIVLSLAAVDEDLEGTPKGEAYRKEAEESLDRALELAGTTLGTAMPYDGPDLTFTQYYLFLETDFRNIATIYRSWEKYDKVFEIVEAALNEELDTADSEDFLADGITLSRFFQDKDKLVAYALRMKEVNPSLSKDMDIIIELAEQGNWGVLDEL